MIAPILFLSSDSCETGTMPDGWCWQRRPFGWVSGAGLIPSPTNESVFAMGAHGRAFTLVLQQPEVGLPLRCSAVSERVPLAKGFV
jgi:hypothetical protein